MHDMLTGSTMEGRSLPVRRGSHLRQLDEAAGAAMLAADRGLTESRRSQVVEFLAPVARSGRRLQRADLRGTGGNGLFYCFAAN